MNPWSLLSSRRDSVVLPAPEGDDSTYISPRRATFRFDASSPSSLQVLHLFAELFDYAFKFKADVSELEIVGLGGQRI